MTIDAPPIPASAARSAAPSGRGFLAIALQEAFTAAARLRANRQVAADADSFRVQIKHLLAKADMEARAAGYDPADVKLAIYGYIAFLDESVLNSGQPMFQSWPRQPLQEEIFGDHRGGQLFFNHLDDLLARPDTEQVADVLEVFQLSLLLGFRGRYGAGDDGGLKSRQEATRRKIERIRGTSAVLAPPAALPIDEQVPKIRDPWLRKLLVLFVVLLAGTVALYLVFSLSLGSEVDQLRAMAARILS